MLLTFVGLTSLSVSNPRKSAGGYSVLPTRRRREAESEPLRKKITGSVSRIVAEFLFMRGGGEKVAWKEAGGKRRQRRERRAKPRSRQVIDKTDRGYCFDTLR